VKVCSRAETRPFSPHHGRFRSSSTNIAEVDATLARSDSLQHSGSGGASTSDALKPRRMKRLATYWLPGKKSIKGQMQVTL
jgi:hypothetical protein